MPPDLSRWCHSHWQALLHEVVFYMAALADILYSSSNNYQKKGKTLQREADSGSVPGAAVMPGGKWMLNLSKLFISTPRGRSPGRGGRMSQTPLVRSDEDSNTVWRQKRISHRGNPCGAGRFGRGRGQRHTATCRLRCATAAFPPSVVPDLPEAMSTCSWECLEPIPAPQHRDAVMRAILAVRKQVAVPY